MPVLEAKPEVEERTQLAPRYRVLLHNDDITPMDFVVDVLIQIFALGGFRAFRVMLEAHRKGVAHVVSEPLERAEAHVDQARSLARTRGYPLCFSIEPEV